MAEAQRGNAEAYRALLDDIGPEVMSFLRARVTNPQEVEDLYQETFLALHRARRTYKPPRPVEPWLFATFDGVLVGLTMGGDFACVDPFGFIVSTGTWNASRCP